MIVTPLFSGVVPLVASTSLLPLLILLSSNYVPNGVRAFGFLSPHLPNSQRSTISRSSIVANSEYDATTRLSSTPFDVSLYDSNDEDYKDDDDSNPFASSRDRSPLAVSPSTRLVIGLNKYSHDTSLCAADVATGRVLFALSKERLSRRKHDGGNVASLVEVCLTQLELDLDCVERVVVNNHHHRVLGSRGVEHDYDHMEWEGGLGINAGSESGYTDDENIFNFLREEKNIELSHHLAHAYSTISQCPFSKGLVVVMDGMGETYRTMRHALDNQNSNDGGLYISDLSFEGLYQSVPDDILEKTQNSIFDWREGESVYVFEKSEETGLSVKPIFKRFVEERSPPTLYNHGFENMDSVGALYSRASSHIFGDWNACGKVMGLAPWIDHSWESQTNNEDHHDTSNGDTNNVITAKAMDHPVMWGKLYLGQSDEDDTKNNAFVSDRSSMKGMPFISRNDPDLFVEREGIMVRKRRYDFDDNNNLSDDVMAASGEPVSKKEMIRLPTRVALDAIALSSRIQSDLELVVMDFVKHFKEKTGETNLCLAGGVALNSVLNGRLSRELGFEHVFVPPYPGDDGIAVGCCAYGLYGNAAVPDKVSQHPEIASSCCPPLWSEPLSPYLGPMPSFRDIQSALTAASPWLDVEHIRSDQERIGIMAREIESGGVIAWYHGRSELGPRALGHRSILADPRRKGLVRFINESVKKRETFRPFAPSVLAEEAANWFELGSSTTLDASPYMSITATVKKEKRLVIPAVTHVDGSSRLQTVTEQAEPLYHKLIFAFFQLTGVPMVLNTSFNTLPGEPITESPKDAIRSFLCSMGSIEMLVLGEYVIKRKDANVSRLLGEERKRDGLMMPPSNPKRAGFVEYETKFTIGAKSRNNDDGKDNNGAESIQTVTRVRMPDRVMHNEKDSDGGWFELLDDLEGEILGVCDGTVGVNEIGNQYFAPIDNDDDEQKTSAESIEFQENLFGNIIRRLVRLFEYGFISW